MTVMQSNLALIQTVPERQQSVIHDILVSFLSEESPFSPKSEQQIFAELAESRKAAEAGEGTDFDEVIDELEAKYGL